MANLTTELDNAWKSTQTLFGGKGSWMTDPCKCNDIQLRLSYFSQSHLADAEAIDDIFMALSRGFNLTKAAIQWDDPVVGNQTSKPTPTDKARGIQWRLVMAYSGFEIVTKTLLNKGKGGLGSTEFIDFTTKCSLSVYSALVSPNVKSNNFEWLNKPEADIGKEALLDFLNVERGDLKILQQWIIQSQPISTWAEAAQLAKALRNASAHGALSATKVIEWALRDTMLKLGNNLSELVVVGLGKLTTP